MSARVLAVLTLAASIGLALPGTGPEPAAFAATPMDAAADEAAPVAYDVSLTGLHSAVEAAVRSHVPGFAGKHWELQRLDHSDPDADGARRVVATGVVDGEDAPATGVQLTGRYDPATGELTRVGYRLQAADAAAPDPQADDTLRPDPAWSVQQAVQLALSESMPGHTVRFALDSAQSVRLDDGGRRFEGFGIGTWGSGGARFVAFTLVLSPDGEATAFDYGTASDEGDPTLIARY